MSKRVLSNKVRLTDEKKLELMKEYMKETSKDVKADTVYKGYKIGHMRANLRQAYFNGTLRMKNELLQEFMEAGIISEEKERIRTSQQEKYDFLMGLAGKEEEEIENARMNSGLRYDKVKWQMQVDYNKGKLKLSKEQIENLRKSGFLDFSKKEKTQISENCGLPEKYAVSITKKYGSYEKFLEKYKKCETDYNFEGNVFCGHRGVTISSKEMTEEQKLGYVTLLKDLVFYDKIPGRYDNGVYINLDEVDNIIGKLPEQPRRIIQMYYGLNGEKMSYVELAKSYGISKANMNLKKEKIFKILKRHYAQNRKEICVNLQEVLARYENEKDNLQEYMYDLNTIMSFITDENGSPKKLADIEDVELVVQYVRYKDGTIRKYHIDDYIENEDEIEEVYESGVVEGNTIRKLIKTTPEGESEYRTIKDLIKRNILTNLEKENVRRESIMNSDINEIGFSTRACNCLSRAGLHKVREITELSEQELKNMRNMGDKTVEEIYEKLQELGVIVRLDNMEKEEKADVSLELYENLPIDELDLSTRAMNIFSRNNIKTIYQLIQLSEQELNSMRNMGVATMVEVKEKLSKFGLRLRNKDEEENSEGIIKIEDKQEEGVKEFLETCRMLYQQSANELEWLNSQKDVIDRKIARYEIARYNYFKKENIFDQNGIVPAVPEEHCEELAEQINEKNEDNLEEQSIDYINKKIEVNDEEAIEKVKVHNRIKELIKSIEASQRELQELLEQEKKKEVQYGEM